MVYFTYSHIAFITVLAFAATISGELTNVTLLENLKENSEHGISRAISELKFAEGEIQNITDKILSQNASLRGEVEEYTACLETAYKYKWGRNTFRDISNGLLDNIVGNSSDDAITCYLEEATGYEKKMEAFPIEGCHKNLASANKEGICLFPFYIPDEINNTSTYTYDKDLFSDITIPSS
uniref:Uncharacterized protein n=1 Tax=Trichobilharzia regenti TaxID=157069 RepID=A0AA85JL19_TRIRE|nr:unnamed protein product [Trichobilharzia regenti]